MNLILGTQLFETPRLGLFLDSVRQLVKAHPMDCYSMHAMDHAPLQPLPKPFMREGHDIRLAKDIIPGSTSDKPCVTDIFTRLAQLNANGWFMFVNSDVEINPELYDRILNHKDNVKAYILYRRDYNPYGNFSMATGQDGFMVDSQWWLKHSAKYREVPDILGMPGWDNAFTATMMDLVKDTPHKVVHVKDALFHRVHEQKWNHDSMEWQTWLGPRWTNCPSRKTWESFDQRAIQ